MLNGLWTDDFKKVLKVLFFLKPLMIWFRKGDTALTRYRDFDIFI